MHLPLFVCLFVYVCTLFLRSCFWRRGTELTVGNISILRYGGKCHYIWSLFYICHVDSSFVVFSSQTKLVLWKQWRKRFKRWLGTWALVL